MSARPEVLFPLFAALTSLEGVGPKTAQNMGTLGVKKPRDLLFLLPFSGIDRTLKETVQGADLPATLTVEVEVGQHRPPRNKGGAYRIDVIDSQIAFQLVFFHARGDYLSKLLPTGQRRVVSGKVELFDGLAQMVHPDHAVRVEDAEQIPSFEPVYPFDRRRDAKTLEQIHSKRFRTCSSARRVDRFDPERPEEMARLAGSDQNGSCAEIDR